MTGTMTWVGLDVHARSTHAAAIDTMTGELRRGEVRAGHRRAGCLAGGVGGGLSARVMRRARRGSGCIARPLRLASGLR
jgi:hypothetical protein